MDVGMIRITASGEGIAKNEGDDGFAMTLADMGHQ